MKKLVLALLVLPLLSPAPAAAAATKKKPPTPGPTAEPLRHIGGAGSWQAYVFSEKSGPVCYLVGDPKKSEPARFKRKPAVAMVTHRPKEGVVDVVSFTEGYPLKSGSNVALDIDGSKFSMFTKGDTAWSPTAELDKTIVKAMTKGHAAIVKGAPQKGPATTDDYSLAGFTHALSLIDKACNVKQ
ncbi:MAG TPA: invasion associated locus B family protein [Stellaceae bacterium]|nr:invasion associated locus B family protein [Stellaceae bacterium]